MAIRVREHRPDTTRRAVQTTRLVALACVLVVAVAACSGEGTDTTTSSSTEPEPTTTTTLPPDPAVDGPILRVGLGAPISETNWWAVMDSSGTAESRAILDNTKEALFTLTKPGFAHVAALAATPKPVPATQEGTTWVVEQPMRQDVFWSDGEQVTSQDLVFYFGVVREFALGGAHASNFPGSVTDVSAADEFTVRVEFASQPSVGDWQTSVAMAPLVPAHFWEPHVEAARAAAKSAREGTSEETARAAVAAASLTDADPGNDVTPEEVTDSQIGSHRAAVAAEAGRGSLYSVKAPQEPSSGSLILESWEEGVAITRSNPDYFRRGVETTVYSDGSVRVASRRSDVVYGGEAAGDVVAHHVVGPFVSAVHWRQYETGEVAHEALLEGEVDFVIDPDGLTFTQYNDLAGERSTRMSISPADGFRFLAFNLRKPPMSDPVFRKAVATVIDRELIASSLFNGTLFPAYSVVHPDLTPFHATDLDRAGWSGGQPMGTGERFEAAVGMLADAGYTWDVEPEVTYDEDGTFTDVVAGGGLEMPNGVDVPDLTILAAPGTGEDPVRATYALWVEQWMTDLGIPVTAETTDLESIAQTAVEPQTSEELLSWDLHVLGWGGPDPALPGLTLVALFHSSNGVEAGGLNTTGYSSPEFDAAAEAFLAARTIDEAATWTKEMDRIIARDLPYVTLYRPAVIEAFGSAVAFPVQAIMNGHGAVAAWPESVRISR